MRIRLLLVVLILSQLSACGFQLRGSNQIAGRFNPLYVESGQLQSTQLTLIRKELIKASATLSGSQDGSNHLRVEFSPLKSRKIASSNLTDVELVQLTMGIRFSVQSESGHYLLELRELVQKVEIELDNANVLGQEQVISRASLGIQRVLVRSMMSQLSR